MRSLHFIAAAFGAALLATPAAAEPLKAVASFSILGDLVKQVGGDRVSVTTLVGPDGDAHVFSPSPADAKTVAGAQAIFENGLGFEGWIDRLVRSSGAKGTVVIASKGVEPIRMEEEEEGHAHGKHEKGHDHDEKAGHDHGETDPHAWQSVANAKVYVANIRDGLITADPEGKAAYEANAASYMTELDKLDGEIKAAIGAIRDQSRKIITSHDAFGYFGKAYGLEILAPQGVSTDSEASAKDVARLIKQIKKAKVPAVFVENVTDKRLISRIAKESGAKVGGTLYSDALSPADGPAATYLDMMRSNLRELTAALSS